MMRPAIFPILKALTYSSVVLTMGWAGPTTPWSQWSRLTSSRRVKRPPDPVRATPGQQLRRLQLPPRLLATQWQQVQPRPRLNQPWQGWRVRPS